MEKDIGVEVYRDKSAALIERGHAIVIKDGKGVAEATEILSRMNKAGDAIKDKKDEVMRPLLDAVNAERKRWKPLEDTINGVISRVRGLLSDYQTAEVRRQRDEEAKIASRVGEGKGKFKPETAIRKMEEMEEVETKVETESGGLSFREKAQVKVVDKKLIPLKFLEPDLTTILAALKDGEAVAGCELEIIQVPINKR